MNIEVSEMRVKNEPIYDSQSISDIREPTSRNNQQSIKHERQFIPISETNKRTREDISSDDQPNKRKRQSMKVKKEPINIEMQTTNSHIESLSKDVEIKAELENRFKLYRLVF
jgi:hypothetical protein